MGVGVGSRGSWWQGVRVLVCFRFGPVVWTILDLLEDPVGD